MFLKVGFLWTSISWALVRSTEFHTPPQSYWISSPESRPQGSVLISPPGALMRTSAGRSQWETRGHVKAYTLLEKTLWEDKWFLFKNLFFRERRREERKEGEKYGLVASCLPSVGNRSCNPGMYPDWVLNQQPFGLQDGAQPTEPHQPGQQVTFKMPIIHVSPTPGTVPGTW